MLDEQFSIGEAIIVFLRNYPGTNEEEFAARFGTGNALVAVRGILNETSRIRIDWGDKSLIEIGDEIEKVMHDRHPELSAAALESIANYFTYLAR